MAASLGLPKLVAAIQMYVILGFNQPVFFHSRAQQLGSQESAGHPIMHLGWMEGRMYVCMYVCMYGWMLYEHYRLQSNDVFNEMMR
jgi:hypothetical protein